MKALPLTAIALFGAIATVVPGCSCGGGDAAPVEGCGPDCKQTCGPPLVPGLIGSYTSIATTKDGTIWVAGYNDAIVDGVGQTLLGDLAVGKWNDSRQAVDWESVDGVPAIASGCPNNDRTGWRGGNIESGPDVGLWTSMALDATDKPMVAYYDATHKSLRYAFLDDGGWHSYEVVKVQTGDVGRYAKVALVGGNPVIAFLVMEPGRDGHLKSRITLAKAQSSAPRASSDWGFEDVHVDETAPCRSWTCTEPTAKCITQAGTCQQPSTGCKPACGNGKVCATIQGKEACGDVASDLVIEAYPNAFADYIAMAQGPSGLGIVVYDRIHGNLVALENQSGSWEPVILDGETGSRSAGTAHDSGDVGIGASLFIDKAGDWHVTYVNGFSEALQYVRVPGGKSPLRPEVVDTGSGLGSGAKPFDDGRHVVGDDSNVRVADDGTVVIAYQDATAGTLRIARGKAGGGGAHTWSVNEVAQPGKFGGFFPQLLPDGKQVTNYWRKTDRSSKTIVGDVSLLKLPL